MLEILSRAIESIQPKYFERKERDFSYELYHQFRLLNLKNDIEVTAETPKSNLFGNQISVENEELRNLLNSNGIRHEAVTRVPDIIIHEYENLNQQLLAIEIKKSASINQVKRDLAKLIAYCRGRLMYKNGVLILINPRNNINRIFEVPEIREMLRNYPEIEIWTVFPERIDFYNSLTI